MVADQFSNIKIFYHDRKIREVLNGCVTMPSVVELSLSGYCNQNCVYCCSSPFQSDKMLSREEIHQIVIQLRNAVKAVTITGGGEPSLNPEFSYCLDLLNDYTIPYGLITNGVSYTESMLDEVVRTAQFCRVSIDSVNEETYARIRRSSNKAENVLKNISHMVNRKKEWKNNILIGLHIVLLNQSDEDIYDTIQTSKNIGVDFVQIRPLDNIPYKHFSPNYEAVLSRRTFLEYLRDEFSDSIFKLVLNTDKFEEYYQRNLIKNYEGCPGANFTASIGHDNCVYFCCTHLGDVNFNLGCLTELTFEDILMGERRAEIIKGCDKSGCQMQCRNHKINKLITSINANQIDELLELHSKEEPPLHWQFL